MPLGNDLVQAVPSQVAIVYWNVLPSVPRDPTGQIHTEDMPPPLPMGNIPFESPSSGFESSSPSALHTRLHHEGPMYYQGVGSGCFGTTHQQPTLSPQITDPHSLVFDYTTTFTVPGTTVERPLATPTRSSPPTLDPSADAPVEYTEDVLQFLRMRGHQYECLWEDGSGRLCGYLGSLVGVKRHLRDSHRLERYAPGHTQSLDDQLTHFHRSTFCSVCEKSFYNPYSLRLHKNQQ